jgi:hypothetical protein
MLNYKSINRMRLINKPNKKIMNASLIFKTLVSGVFLSGICLINPEKEQNRQSEESYHQTGLDQSPVRSRLIINLDDFDWYSGNEELAKTWYHPGYHGGPMERSLEPRIKNSGKYSLKCEYTNLDDPTKYYSPVCRVSKWDASGTDAIRFWYKPDGSGRIMTIQFNIANKDGKNIHDLWEYTYSPARGDTAGVTVVLPYSKLNHNVKYADSPDTNPVYRPGGLIEIALYIGGKNDGPGKGVYYFDSIVAIKTDGNK